MVVQAPLSGRLVGFVMAGGRSTRMGRDKALLPWEGSTLLDHAIARLAQVTPDVRILCGPIPRYQDRGRTVVVDVTSAGGSADAASGPLAGLAAGLASAGDRDGLYLAVDLPHVTVGLLAALAAIDGADAVVPVTARGPEPLCAVYRPRCLGAVTSRLASGEHRMTSFWPDVRVEAVGGHVLAAFGDEGRLFHNVNAPPDYAGGKGAEKSRP